MDSPGQIFLENQVFKSNSSASSINEAEHSKLVLWDNSEGWGGEGEGRGVQDGGTHVHPWLIHMIYGKNHHNTVK